MSTSRFTVINLK